MIDTTHLKMKGYEVRKYFRKWSRKIVNIPAKVEILLDGGRRFTHGTVLIRDISLKGARLGKFVLKKPCFPTRPFRIHLSFRSEKYEGVGAIARPIRFGTGHDFEIAVAFEDIWAGVKA